MTEAFRFVRSNSRVVKLPGSSAVSSGRKLGTTFDLIKLRFPSYELLHSSPQLITSRTKRFDTHNPGCFQLTRISHAPVQLAFRPIEPRTSGSRHIADRDHAVKVFTDEFLNRF